MIESTFVLLKGVGDKTEQRWWASGLVNWDLFRRERHIPLLSSARKDWYDAELDRANQAFASRDGGYFGTYLRPRDQWRLFSLFGMDAAYLDIETTGGPPVDDAVTVVGVHRRGCTTQLVAGIDLTARRINELLDGVSLLVTFFGSVFDVPFLARVYPSLRWPPLHWDLCFGARRIGLTGGLKSLERQLDLVRPIDLEGLDGWDAISLWHDAQAGDALALDRLLRYNAADIEHLVPLADHLYSNLLRRCGPAAVSLLRAH